MRIALRAPAASSLRAAFIATAIAWAALLVVAPWLASRPHASPLATAVILGVYSIGSLVCHQLPERSYHLWTMQLPVCARCAGIYGGAVIGAIAGALRMARRRRPRPAARPGTPGPSGVRFALAVAVTPSLVTLVYEWTTGVMPPHAVRAAAGLPIGLVVAWLVVAAEDNQVN